MNQSQKKMPDAWRQNDRRARVSAWDQIRKEITQATPIQWISLGFLASLFVIGCAMILMGVTV